MHTYDEYANMEEDEEDGEQPSQIFIRHPVVLLSYNSHFGVVR